MPFRLLRLSVRKLSRFPYRDVLGVPGEASLMGSRRDTLAVRKTAAIISSFLEYGTH